MERGTHCIAALALIMFMSTAAHATSDVQPHALTMREAAAANAYLAKLPGYLPQRVSAGDVFGIIRINSTSYLIDIPVLAPLSGAPGWVSFDLPVPIE